MKSAVLIAGATLLFAGFEGVLASSNPQVLASQEGTPAAASGDLDGESTLPLNDLHHHHHHGHHHHGHHHHGHHHHHHGHHHHQCEKPPCLPEPLTKTIKECLTITKPPCTVTKSCTAISKCTVTNTCTVKVPDPTTVVKNNFCTVTAHADPVTVTKMKVCTSTVVKSKTLTKCVDRFKTQTEYFPKYTTKTATVTVDPPKCTPAPTEPCCLATQQQYVIEEGDDINEIAALYNTTVSTLLQDNAFLTDSAQLEVGDILCVPSSESDNLVEKRDAACHKDHPSCDEAPEDPLCCDHHKKHHHHHHHHKHHHHKHHKHHKHHHHHHHKPTKTTTQIEVVTPRPELDGEEDSPIHCGLCHAWHNVWPGDSIESIAHRYSISCGEVLHLNPWIGSGNKLHEGEWVCVAGCDVPVRFDPISKIEYEECAPEHICVPCARPGVCPRGGKHALCPENYSCERV